MKKLTVLSATLAIALLSPASLADKPPSPVVADTGPDIVARRASEVAKHNKRLEQIAKIGAVGKPERAAKLRDLERQRHERALAKLASFASVGQHDDNNKGPADGKGPPDGKGHDQHDGEQHQHDDKHDARDKKDEKDKKDNHKEQTDKKDNHKEQTDKKEKKEKDETSPGKPDGKGPSAAKGKN